MSEDTKTGLKVVIPYFLFWVIFAFLSGSNPVKGILTGFIIVVFGALLTMIADLVGSFINHWRE